MALINFRKETSERSDSLNWAKKLLTERTDFFFESIEGCSQNTKNVVTHLFERMRVDYDASMKGSLANVAAEIVKIESKEVLERKINFCKCFGLNLSYVLYCDETENVFLFEFETVSELKFIRLFENYAQFSNWIKEIKGWISNKPFRESQDLPFFDKILRNSGTAWPTNIDCFVCNADAQPIGIIEFQNAKNTRVETHCNNDFFLCKFINSNDIRRWLSQEILRVQASLRFFVITWSQSDNDYQLKEIEKIVFPSFFDETMKIDWRLKKTYQSDLNKYVLNKNAENENIIANNYKTYSLFFEKITQMVFNKPPLNKEYKTFPSLYYHSKKIVKNNKEQLVIDFKNIIVAKF